MYYAHTVMDCIMLLRLGFLNFTYSLCKHPTRLYPAHPDIYTNNFIFILPEKKRLYLHTAFTCTFSYNVIFVKLTK